MKSYQAFFAELKRRRVFKVTAVYGAVAFVLLQVAELLGQGLRLPESFMPFMTAVILLGFPLALILAWAFEITPEGVQKTGAAAPGELESIVAEPASKRWPAGALALLGVVALLAGAWWAGRRSAPGTDATADGARSADVQLAFADLEEDPRPSIAVLPFVNLSADENQEYFSDGITEEILNTLARIDELRVSGRTSAFAYKGRNVDLREIGRELGVRYLIEGSVRKAEDQLRITAQLIDASDGSHLWSDQYDRTLEDVFAIQTDIAEAIAGELRVPLGLEGDETLVTPTADLTAYDLYLAGRSEMRKRGLSLLEAERLFEAAIARDSTWAPAWAALAETREIRIWYPRTFPDGIADSASVQRLLEESELAARRALDLNPRNSSALVALGSVQRDRGQWQAAEATYRNALALDPDNAEAHQQYAEFLREVGRIAEYVRTIERAVALDPAPIRLSMLGIALKLDDRPDEAARVYEVAMERDPDVTLGQVWGGAFDALIKAGRNERAIEVGTVALGGLGPRPGMDAEILSDPESVGVLVRSIVELDIGRMSNSARAMLSPELWMLAGEPDSALARLSADPLMNAGVAGGTRLWDPVFDPLRSDPRFEALIKQTKVPRSRPLRTPAAERTTPLLLRSARGDPGEKAP